MWESRKKCSDLLLAANSQQTVYVAVAIGGRHQQVHVGGLQGRGRGIHVDGHYPVALLHVLRKYFSRYVRLPALEKSMFIVVILT